MGLRAAATSSETADAWWNEAPVFTNWGFLLDFFGDGAHGFR